MGRAERILFRWRRRVRSASVQNAGKLSVFRAEYQLDRSSSSVLLALAGLRPTLPTTARQSHARLPQAHIDSFCSDRGIPQFVSEAISSLSIRHNRNTTAIKRIKIATRPRRPAIFQSQVTHFSWVCTSSRSDTQSPRRLSLEHSTPSNRKHTVRRIRSELIIASESTVPSITPICDNTMLLFGQPYTL
jgi:hypothetical protein